ncbi:MAG TPA: ATP-binding protein [Tepidisphaeraceae bacterium]|jgi:two-component system sensor histidine kinase PhcS|nr:ATP-binding protein [Tepidisphaeraceae bacterium]
MSDSSPSQPLPTALVQAYKEFYVGLRIRQAKICFPLAVFLVPACVGLDYFVYPDLAWPFFKVRLLCSLAMLPFLISLFKSWGQRNVRWIDSMPLILSAFSISWMIYATEGAHSPYYAGLNIVMAAAILLVPYTLAEALGICGFVVSSYVAACTLHHVVPMTAGVEAPPLNVSIVVNNFYFLVMTAMIAMTSNHFNARRRFQEFRLRYELDQNNVELATTVRKLKETEVQLVQSEKMNALGKLSAGLLHEINNPLNFTFMALECAEQEVGDNESLKETLTDIGQGMGRIRSVIADLRAFAYPSKLTDEHEFSLEEALTTAGRLTAQELKDIPIDGSAVVGVNALGAKTQVMHVFMNLLINAAHAIRAKGPLNNPQITITATARNGRLAVSVRDNGTGVSKADMPRVFEPFFTTKQPGEGTGLGLSICQTIIENHGGSISVASEVGQWTEVTFDLGLAAARKEAA